ncbi:MAG: hypothetical protein WAO76_18020 [Georgfuchsia sp.]
MIKLAWRNMSCFMKNLIISAWLQYEASPTALDRINALKEAATKHGYYIYIVHFKPHAGYRFSLTPVSQRVALKITERSPAPYAPIAYSGNLEDGMLRDKAAQRR